MSGGLFATSRTAKEVRASLKAHRVLMRERGIRKISSMNRVDAETARANNTRRALELELDAAVKREAGGAL